ncbi:MAG: response regulator [Anaerolineales bacterium]|nr:response regulator [Anaerolineales bacterium]
MFAFEIRGHQHYLTTMRDITTEKQAEDTLRLANAELARAARSKDEFLANMSHELRTPLNAILGFSEALLEQVRGPLNERQQASLRNIEASGRHLLALISDILDLSKVEAGRLELLLEVVPVADICQTSLLFVKEVALKKQLQLAFHLDNQMAKVQADPKRLKQMLVNLLSNAVKFTPEGGQVSLEVTTDAEAGVIHFAVQDSGIGIPPQEMARLFQPFTQLDSSLSRQYEGTGLGLALVRRLAELHSGSVTVESEGVPGRGSRFTIALPNPTLQRTEPKLLERKTGTGPLQTALVVEDSESAAEQLERYLQEAKIRVAVHPQGEGVLNQAVRLSPGVIFLDLLMPGQTGWEVLAQLKADPRTQDIPVIIVSVVDERAKGLAAGAVEYLVKPISRETLRQVMSAVVGTPESVREALVIVPETGRIRARILLAEDNEINIEVINEYLQDEGYRVVLARNGREALAQATEIRPDLILMDIQMPEMDGLEAIRRLRARAEFATTPIIALTALAMPGDRERCLDAGATEYLTKPVSLKRLVELIEELLKHQA